MVMQMIVEPKVEDTMYKHADTSLKRDVLDFWRRYPYAKFTCGIVARAVSSKRRLDVEEALECLVRAELLDKHIQQGMPFYSLTAEPSRRQNVLDLPANTFRPFYGRS